MPRCVHPSTLAAYVRQQHSYHKSHHALNRTATKKTRKVCMVLTTCTKIWLTVVDALTRAQQFCDVITPHSGLRARNAEAEPEAAAEADAPQGYEHKQPKKSNNQGWWDKTKHKYGYGGNKQPKHKKPEHKKPQHPHHYKPTTTHKKKHHKTHHPTITEPAKGYQPTPPSYPHTTTHHKKPKHTTTAHHKKPHHTTTHHKKPHHTTKPHYHTTTKPHTTTTCTTTPTRYTHTTPTVTVYW